MCRFLRKTREEDGKVGGEGNKNRSFGNMHKFIYGKLSNSTIAVSLKIWYDEHIQVNYAYSRK